MNKIDVDSAFEEGFTGKSAGPREYLDAPQKAAPSRKYTDMEFLTEDERAKKMSEGTKIFSFSDKELKEMDEMKEHLQKGYEEQFSYYNRGAPPTQKQKDHAEDAAIIAAAQKMMATQAFDKGGKSDWLTIRNYGVGADMSDAGDAAVQARQDNRPSRRAELIQRKRPAP